MSAQRFNQHDLHHRESEWSKNPRRVFGRRTKTRQALLQIGPLHKQPGLQRKSAPFVIMDLIEVEEQKRKTLFRWAALA